ncbi:hypothetical protein HN011_001121 [Eciton burchellii]|nr:hypothetical protein HN011_001121 [Eciton burchellii]
MSIPMATCHLMPDQEIRQEFALLKVKIALTAILRKWRIKSVKTQHVTLSGGLLIFRPCEEIFLHLIPKE